MKLRCTTMRNVTFTLLFSTKKCGHSAKLGASAPTKMKISFLTKVILHSWV
jgi:hypothetical protein